ncbi:DEKNAAC104000 [Brettanomyces naardenensis]|uniref:Dolichol phosphate-mannose biosynthesis regulatory protein n=1 Tax=Brettanomyces naardenensis TaxID=13370 RepID=A0A448YQ63_BRENA|nr:DEKNAAC104000 [Brettanomyces naardenensis]
MLFDVIDSSTDQLVGFLMLLAATAIFVYYTVWTFVLPFLDDDKCIQKFFLPREYAIKIPVVLLIIGVTLIGVFISSVLIKTTNKKKKGKKQN